MRAQRSGCRRGGARGERGPRGTRQARAAARAEASAAALALALALALVVAALGAAGCGRDQGRGGQAAPGRAEGQAAPAGRAESQAAPAGRAEGQTAPAGRAQGQEPPAGAAGAARVEGGLESVGDNQLTPAAGAIQVRSREGGFSAQFPDGCARVRTRAAPAGAAPGEHETVSVWSDRFERRGEGVMVTTFYKLRGENGGPPNPRTVVGKIEEMLQRHNLEVVEQHAFNRDGLEGVRAFCRERGGDDVMWIEGLLFADRVYILSGWRSAGGTLSDGQIARFFTSFRPESAS